jgi:hypothetical protein
MHDPSIEQTLDYRIAVGRFESALEASELLTEYDRGLLLRDIAKKILQQLTPTKTPRTSTPPSFDPAVLLDRPRRRKRHSGVA